MEVPYQSSLPNINNHLLLLDGLKITSFIKQNYNDQQGNFHANTVIKLFVNFDRYYDISMLIYDNIDKNTWIVVLSLATHLIQPINLSDLIKYTNITIYHC